MANFTVPAGHIGVHEKQLVANTFTVKATSQVIPAHSLFAVIAWMP